LVTSSLIRETTENESANEGYKFGQEEELQNAIFQWRFRLLKSTCNTIIYD